MNIVALQTRIGINQVSTNKMQNGGPANSKFGAVFAGVTSKTPKAKSPTNGEIPIESIPNLFNATTVEGLESAVQAIQGNEHVAFGSSGSLEEVANWLSINPEEMLKKLQQLLEEAGISKGETEELNISADMWTLLNMIDEAGIRFFENLNEELQNPGTKNEATQLLSLLKTIELLAPKSDMDLWMEQKVDSFRHMMTAAAGHFEQRMETAGKQEQLPFLNQKTDFRIVLETNSSTSANAEGSGQKQADTTPQSGAVHATSTIVKAEMPIQQAEPNPTNRSETLLREMQALMKRSNFGQVGGTNRMLIKLYPEHLGQIRIELLETNGVMTARILASTALAKGMLDSQLHQLKHAFNQQNLQVDRVDIAQTIQESQRNEREQSFNEQFKREQQTDDNKKNQSSEEELSFEEHMIELEV
ncbi:flagellar hook-length control protein FliK [Sporosarcina luteola]|uniref:flagellar hook-length control protein FliK n=1 Tax=Sporosarcina luteola TaxID=582850 RepID=UPI00203B93FC|nr:flagellar hook-length control protein FliK [Sporosarcina luteola]